jgi:Tol biopolymer transport system component
MARYTVDTANQSDDVLSVGEALALVVVAAILILAISASAWAHGITERVSLGPSSTQGNERSLFPAISADGRFVAFDAEASNLVRGDTNNARDVFVRDRQTGTTERVSVGPRGVQGNEVSWFAAISADGRFVVFQSSAFNLVAGDTENEFIDLFVRDRQTGTTERVSVGLSGVQTNGDSFGPAISDDGRFVAFASQASNLVQGDSNGLSDVFVRDRQMGTTRRISLGPGGVQSNGDSGAFGPPKISADGRFVTFQSFASNLVSGDTNGQSDVFVRDRQTGTTERVSLGSRGVQANEGSFGPAISADGRFVAFTSNASNLVPHDTNALADVFVYDRQMGMTERVNLGPLGVQANDNSSSSSSPAISPHGRFVAFDSFASNLVSNDTNKSVDVFVYDRQLGTTHRVSVGPSGVQSDSHSESPVISADGRFVAFLSSATNLISGGHERSN